MQDHASIISPKMLRLGKEEDTVLQQLLLEFGLRDDVIVQPKILIGKPKLGQAYDYSDENTKSSYEKCKVMKFDHLPKEKPHNIQTILKEERKSLLAANNDILEKRLLFEEENNNLRFFLGDDEDMVVLNASGIIMATKRSTLGMCKDSTREKQFDDPLWTQKDKKTPEKQWSCEEVAKWVIAIEGMPENVGDTFVMNDVNGAALLAMRQGDFKGIVMTKKGPLALLLKETASLCTKDIFVEHNYYFFGNILDTLRLQ